MNAQITVKDYKATLSNDDVAKIVAMKLYISGVGDGLLWANAEATRRKIPLFCEPNNLKLLVDNYIDMINSQIGRLSQPGGASKSELDDLPIGMLLLKGLEGTFPCETK